MRYLEIDSTHAFVEVYRDATTRDPLEMTGVSIEIVHYDDSPTPTEIVDVSSTAMTSMGDGKFVHFQEIDSATFEANVTYYARTTATHPTDLTEELAEQVFTVIPTGSTGRLGREQFAEGDYKAFVVDYRDASTREPLDMVNVTIEIVYYENLAPTPVEVEVLAPTPMVSLGEGRYVYPVEIDSSFPTNTEFFVRYRGTHPTDGTEELVQEEFSSFETVSTGGGLEITPVEPF